MKSFIKKFKESNDTVVLSEVEFHALLLCVAFTIHKSETDLQFVARDLYKKLDSINSF